MHQPITRSSMIAPRNPSAVLSALFGPKFVEYRRNWGRAEGGMRPPHPLHLDVDVTTACNFRCPMCPAGNSGQFFPGFTPGLFLDHDLYRKALAEGKEFGLPSIRLGMTGEPLLIPDIDDWVREAAAARVLDIALITNGRLLSASLSKRLIEAGLTRLMISVDAGSAEIYSRVRPGGDWEVLLQNIRDFLRARNEAQAIMPLLRISFVEMDVNRADREKFLNTFEPLADYITFQRYVNIMGTADKRSSEARRSEATGCCSQVKSPSDKNDTFCPITSPMAKEKTSSLYCTEPFTRMALHADGGLFPCCSDFGRTKVLGNLKDGSLLATWESMEAQLLCSPDAGEREPCCRCLAANENFTL